MEGKMRVILRNLFAILIAALALGAPARAEEWRSYSLGAYGFGAPADWAVTARRADEIDLASPDGRYQLWARLWLPDEPLLGYDDIVAHGPLTIAGQGALFIHTEGPTERFLQYAFDRKDAKGRQFLFQLIGQGAPLAEHQALFQRLGAELVVDGVRAVPAAATPAPAADPWAAEDAQHTELDDWIAIANMRYGAGDCQPLDLASWSHPTRAVMEARGIAIRFVALCRGRTFPVFGVELPYDAHLAGNDSFFLPFYDAMFRANGKWDFALFSTPDWLFIDVRGRGRPSLEIELYDVPGD
ncbi:hypothetical protein LPB142_07575 [Rhodobacter xanthinilyticus]|uniref:Uncharacterized protein n=2 Tax=Rhodobacter xanthinilyticus TaxID=1850250 RepID=A0A1D9MBI0_9RHOB|nr:hypothetical protein LPB142_07575 [Rhodobacter xanthinilyticus]